MKSLPNIVFEIAQSLGNSGGGVFFEAGAYDGVMASNSLRLERELGWSGILVEPAQAAYDRLVSNRGAENFFVRACLVQHENQSTAKGFFASASLTNSANPEIMASFSRSGESVTARESVRIAYRNLRRRFATGYKTPIVKKTVSVPATTLSAIVHKAGVVSIDLWTLDIEGNELPALKGFDFSVRPRVMIIETRGSDENEIYDLMNENGYEFLGYLSPEPPAKRGTILWHRDAAWCSKGDTKARDVVRRFVVS